MGFVVREIVRLVDHTDRPGFRQTIAQRDETRGERIAIRHAAACGRQRSDRVADAVGQLGDRSHAFAVGHARGREQTADVTFGRRQCVGDRRHFGHREGAVHGVDRTHQRFVGGGVRTVCARQPAFDRIEMTADFRLQDFEQDRVDADRYPIVLGFEQGAGREVGRDGLESDHRRHLDDGSGCRHRHHFFAASDAFGERFDRVQVGGDDTIAAQRCVQLRQGRVGLLDGRDHRRRRRAMPVAHLVQHVLDFPAELAERLGADQTAAALERVEHATHRLQPFDIAGIRFPCRQQLSEVGDFLFEFLEEDFADFVVDIVACGVETGRSGYRRDFRPGFVQRLCRRGFARRLERGNDGIGSRLFDKYLFNERRFDNRFFDERFFDKRLFDALLFNARHFVVLRFDVVQFVPHRFDRRQRNVRRLCDGQLFGRRLDRFRNGNGDFRHGIDDRRHGNGRFDRRRRSAHGRQRPVAQCFEAVAGDVEDIVARGATVAQRFEVILETRERVREGVELTPVGNAMPFEQFDFGIHPHAVEILRGLRQFEDVQRAGDVAQEFRHRQQFGMAPTGFDERIESLTRGREVGDRFAYEHIEHLAGFGTGEIVFGIGAIAAGQTRDLIVERSIDVQQRAGNIEQCGFVGFAFVVDDLLHRIALLLHERTRQAEAEHAERVGNALQRFRLRLQCSRIVLVGAQIEIKRVLHAQQILLHRRSDRVEQRTIAAGDAAAGVIEFRFGRTQRIEIEDFAQLHQRRMHRFAVRDVVQQLAGRFQRGVGTRRIESTLVEQAAGFAIDAGERLAQTWTGGHGTVAQRAGHHRSHPQHAALGFIGSACEQGFSREMQAFGVARCTLFGPRTQRIAQTREMRRDFVGARGGRLRGGARQRRRQRTVEIGHEQHAFAQTGFAAGGAQFVEHRQQNDRDFLVAALQAFEVIGQQHHAAHQRGACDVAIEAVAGDPFAVLQRDRQPLHFLGDHRWRVKLHHPQRPLHLMQEFGADPHAAGVGRIVGEAFDLDADQTQGFVELGFDPAQRAVFDRLVEGRHRAPPPATARPVSRSESIRIISLVLRSDSSDQAGSLKSATERRRSAASCARFPIDSAVWFAPSEVCAVID